jgi:DNA-binding Xre family transcriptional regulator
MSKLEDDVIVKRIKKLCLNEVTGVKKITPYMISKNSGMNPSTLNNILSGKFKDVRFSTIKNICKGLNVSIKDFFDDELFY